LGLLCSLVLAAPQPIRIEMPGAFTGGSAPMGLSMRNGIRLAAAEINKAGVLGRPIELVERDDGHSGARHQGGAAIAHPGPGGGGGGLRQYRCGAGSQNYQDARVPVMLAVATAAILTRQFPLWQYRQLYFPGGRCGRPASASDCARGGAAFGLSQAGHFADNTNYGYQGLMELERALGQNGLKPSYVARFNLQEGIWPMRCCRHAMPAVRPF
jgi:branched-chain amino acid transport system substrate-binding protein